MIINSDEYFTPEFIPVSITLENWDEFKALFRILFDYRGEHYDFSSELLDDLNEVSKKIYRGVK